ncbi:sensor histidine kinase [Nonomuraea sediminis]|uniref:sensor histidine kinase n=1 Tax=Nonomuraea sediminis TaxID=2835864 RepID=UPI001BDD3D5D|nr:histidine kinase [Nonomuraea sediminis]
MATRPETARKVLLYWMDGMIAFFAVMFIAGAWYLVAEDRISVPHAMAGAGSALAFCAIFPFMLRDAYDERPRPVAKLVVSGLLAAVALVLLPSGAGLDQPPMSWDMVGPLWLSAAALFLSWQVTVAFGVLEIAIVFPYVRGIGWLPWQAELAIQAGAAILLPVATWLWLWLWRTIREAHDSQEAKASLAVSEERLRFARDLHDLLGHSLSVIALKSELAGKLATKDAARAAAEMAAVRHLAGESLTEVRAAVEGYQTLDLEAELAGVRAALEAAGASCTIEASADDLSPAARALLAWVVREGATNVLKHSTATRIAIRIDGGVLEMRNDGMAGPVSDQGSGLRGLSERIAGAGGSLSAAPTGSGEFLLRAAVPA